MNKKDIFTKRDIRENGKEVIFYGDISRKYDCFAQEIINRIDEESYEKATKVEKGQILVNLEDFDDKDIGRCVLYQNDVPAAINGNVAILTLKDSFKDIINLKYISFYLNYKDEVRNYIYKKATGEKVKRLAKSDFKVIEIEIPALETQNKIIHNFLELKKNFVTKINDLEKSINTIEAHSKIYGLYF
ncbi:restriction endonuclease subunit S [Fusobacterium polymorphum]|uniref:restriction endonuclease subunit S n=1 Tax=Fusobacterium nucleatum subsp. polymorphum TaxID=76857 RepID=UPI0030D3B885